MFQCFCDQNQILVVWVVVGTVMVSSRPAGGGPAPVWLWFMRSSDGSRSQTETVHVFLVSYFSVLPSGAINGPHTRRYRPACAAVGEVDPQDSGLTDLRYLQRFL